jgi:hypothetical protein
MDILRAVYKAKPNVQWVNNSVNTFSLDTIKAAYIGDDFPTQEELDTAWILCLKEEKKSQAKEEAYRRIIAILPEWKQRNYIAKSVELTEKKSAGITLTSEEISILDAMKAMWTTIQQIRSASDNIETEIDALSTSEALEAYNVEVNILWP